MSDNENVLYTKENENVDDSLVNEFINNIDNKKDIYNFSEEKNNLEESTNFENKNENDDMDENFQLVKRMYDFYKNNFNDSSVNFGTIYNINHDVSEKAISFSIDKNEDNEDGMFYSFENVDYISRILNKENLVIINDYKGKGKYYTAVNLLFEIEEIEKVNVFNRFISVENLVNYKFEKNCGYILRDYDNNKKLIDSLKFLEENIKSTDNACFVILIDKDKFDIKEEFIHEIKFYSIESPAIKESIISYLNLQEKDVKDIKNEIQNVYEILGEDFFQNIKFESISKLALEIHSFIQNVQYEKRSIEREDVEEYFKGYKDNINVKVNNFFKKNIFKKENIKEILAFITSVVFFENTDIDFIIKKSGELFDLTILKSINNEIDEKQVKMNEFDYLIVEKNFTDILKDAWIEEVEIKNDKNEIGLYNCEKIKVLKFSTNEFKELYIKYIWSKYIGFRKFVLEFLGQFVEAPDNRSTIALVEAIAILAKYDFRSIINKIKSDWIESNPKISRIDSQLKQINASFLLTQLSYKTSSNSIIA
jgi:hypothetical protein